MRNVRVPADLHFLSFNKLSFAAPPSISASIFNSVWISLSPKYSEICQLICVSKPKFWFFLVDLQVRYCCASLLMGVTHLFVSMSLIYFELFDFADLQISEDKSIIFLRNVGGTIIHRRKVTFQKKGVLISFIFCFFLRSLKFTEDLTLLVE